MQHQENPDPATTLLGVAIGAVVIAGIVWAMKSSESPSPTTPLTPAPPQPGCPTYDDIAGFATAKGYHVFYVEKQSVSTWKPPASAYASDPSSRAWSQLDCSFFRWDGATKLWVADVQTEAEFIAFKQAGVASRPAPMLMHHPLRAFVPALG